MRTTTVKDLSVDEALAHLSEGAAFADLRPANDYLEAHVRGSLPLLYEFGPGMANRARDCLPLDLPLILLGDDRSDLEHAAASLKGKGFAVIGALRDGVNQWSRSEGPPASTELHDRIPVGGALLDVGDPGAPRLDGATRIPTEELWPRSSELDLSRSVVVIGGTGVRAALAVGILELLGASDVSMYRS